MNIFRAIGGTFTEVRRNPNIGSFSWILHRLTGLALLLYLFLHMIVLSTSQKGPDSFNRIMEGFHNPLTTFLEVCLIACIAFHLFNGLRIIIADVFLVTRWHRVLAYIVGLLTVAVIVWAAATILPGAFEHV